MNRNNDGKYQNKRTKSFCFCGFEAKLGRCGDARASEGAREKVNTNFAFAVVCVEKDKGNHRKSDREIEIGNGL